MPKRPTSKSATTIAVQPRKTVPIRQSGPQRTVVTVNGKPRMRVSPKRTGTHAAVRVAGPTMGFAKKGVRKTPVAPAKVAPVKKETVSEEQVVPVRAAQKSHAKPAPRPAAPARVAPKVPALPPAMPLASLSPASPNAIRTTGRIIGAFALVAGAAVLILGGAMMLLPAPTIVALKTMLDTPWLSGVTTAFLDWRLGSIATDLINATSASTLAQIAQDPVLATPVAASGRSLLLLGIIVAAVGGWLGYVTTPAARRGR